MQLNQLRPQLAKLPATHGIVYDAGSGVSSECLQQAETRLGVVFPQQIRLWFGELNGLRIDDPPFHAFPVERLERDGDRIVFAVCDEIHLLAFDVSRLNEAGQWDIVAVEPGYRLTLTMASFWTVWLWKWIRDRQPIWQPLYEPPV